MVNEIRMSEIEKGRVSSTNRKAPNSIRASVACNSLSIGYAHFYSIGCMVKLAGYFCSTRGFPKNLQFLLSSAVVLPLYIDTNYNDVGGDALFVLANDCPQVFRVHFTSGLCVQ
jgi:hypothetical protein